MSKCCSHQKSTIEFVWGMVCIFFRKTKKYMYCSIPKIQCKEKGKQRAPIWSQFQFKGILKSICYYLL